VEKAIDKIVDGSPIIALVLGLVIVFLWRELQKARQNHLDCLNKMVENSKIEVTNYLGFKEILTDVLTVVRYLKEHRGETK